MYVMDTGTNQITVYDIAIDPRTPRALAVTQLAGTGRGFELALSDDGRYLQAISQQGDATGSLADNTLHVLRVGSNGLLTEVETDSLTQFVSNPPGWDALDGRAGLLTGGESKSQHASETGW
jgi:6-phosphogluconolactonase (cycloisomerase 2 family)